MPTPKVWPWFTGILILLLGVLIGSAPPVFAQSVEWGYSMDQAFSSNVYEGGSQSTINPAWTNLPWNNPPGWPLQGTTNNSWENKPYIANGTGSTLTVTSGQTFSVSPPELEDQCRASNYGTYGYWRGLMVIANSGGSEAWQWNPPGGNWYGWGSGLDNEPPSCSPGSNYGAAPIFSVTAPTVSSPTTYYADFFAEEAQYTSTADTTVDGDISEFTVPITVNPKAQPPVTVSLSANPTYLPTGQTSTLTATTQNMPSSDYIVIARPSTGTQYGTSGDGATNYSANVSHNTPQTNTFQATVYNSSSQAVATSNSVQVQWYQNSSSSPPPSSSSPPPSSSSPPPSSSSPPPSSPPPSSPGVPNVTVTLSATPTNLPVGNATTLTATITQGWEGNNHMWLKIYDETTRQWLGGSWTNSFTVARTNYSPQTNTFIAYITYYPSNGPTVNNEWQSNTVNVTWVSAPTITLTANPTRLPVGNATALTATASSLPSGDSIAIKGSNGFVTSESSTAQFTWSYGQATAGTTAFTASILNASNQTVATSNPVNVTWYAPTVTLSANPTQLGVGQATTLQATGSQMASGDTLHITGSDGLSVTGSAGAATVSTTDTHHTPQTVSYTATVRNSAGQTLATSHTVSVVWVGVTIAAQPTQLDVNQRTTLTATAQNMPTNDTVIITGSDGLSDSGSTGSSTASTTDIQSTPQTVTYTAKVVNSSGSTVTTSKTVSVTWIAPTITLTANPTHLTVGQTTTLQATATQAPAGDTLVITGTDGLHYRGTAGSSTATTTDIHWSPQTVTYTATLQNGAGHTIATSNTVSVTWVAAGPTGCVPYDPGYEYVPGLPTYNPVACPVPTPVNF